VKRWIAACVVAVGLLTTGASCDPADPTTWPRAAQVALSEEEVPSHDVRDFTGEVLPMLEEMYTTAELIGAGPVGINWVSPETQAAQLADPAYGYVFSFSPNQPAKYPECGGQGRCILLNPHWWTGSGWPDQAGANRVLAAHEFAHVLSLKRKRVDTPYGKAVNRVDEECLADAVAALVLARGGYPPPRNLPDYDVGYQCEEHWTSTYGESRRAEADALAANLLHWTVTGQIIEITGPVTATEGAEREYVYKW
jgi:hypothetical protein